MRTTAALVVAAAASAIVLRRRRHCATPFMPGPEPAQGRRGLARGYHDLRPLVEVPLFVPSVWQLASGVQVALEERGAWNPEAWSTTLRSGRPAGPLVD